MLLAMAMQASAPAADPFGARSWARIERSGSRSVTIEVTIGDYDERTRRYDQILRLTSSGPDEPPVTRWASNRTCPAAAAILSFADLPLPTPSGADAQVDIVLDGVSYAVTLPLRYGRQPSGRATFSSNFGTPLARWVDAALAKLEPCWSTQQPPLGTPPFS